MKTIISATKKLTTLFSAFIFYNTAAAQFINYSIAEGLPSQTVRSISIDTAGNKWFGLNSGLVEFDGSGFTLYDKNSTGLPGNNVDALAIDRNNNFWVATDGTRSGMPSHEVSQLAGSNSVTTFNDAFTIGHSITSISVDTGDVKWIAYSSGNIKRFDGTNWTDKTSIGTGTRPSGIVNEVVSDKNGGRWFASTDGLFKLKGNAWTKYSGNTMGLPDHNFWTNPYVRAVAIDKFGNIWAGTGNGVAVYDGVIWSYYGISNSGLINNTVNDILFDNEGNVWFATYQGLSKLNLSSSVWTNYTTADGLAGNDVQCIALDKQGDLWFGVYGHSGDYGGVSKLASSPSGIREKDQKIKLEVFPNPAYNNFTIKTTNELIGSDYIVSDQLGRVVLTGKITQETEQVSAEKLLPGIYYIRYGSHTIKIVMQ